MKSRTDAKRDAILEVASKAFLELGYERTSMAEISARVGGSKATLYGYFASKEELFLAIIRSVGDKFINPALADLDASAIEDPRQLLQRLGETTLSFICAPDRVAGHRMVMAEAGHSEVGRLFYEGGPRLGVDKVAGYLQTSMRLGRLREADPVVAAMQFLALLSAEVQHLWFYRDKPKPTRKQIAGYVERAVDTFIGGYGVR